MCVHSGEKPPQSVICYKDEYLSKSNACLQEKKSHQECEYEYESQNTNKKFLRVHMCSHTGKKPFKCQNCEAQNRSHTCSHEENQCKCRSCVTQIERKEEETSHIGIHTGENSIQCEICETNGNLKQTSMPSRTQYKRACKQDYQPSSKKAKVHKKEMPSHSGEKPNGHNIKVLEENKVKPSDLNKAKIYERYMDDCLTSIKRAVIIKKLEQINSLHPALTFTYETEKKHDLGGDLSFLDMLLLHRGCNISTTWFTKETDTGLVLNFHSLAPMKYKRALIIGMVHRIYRACSEWKHITDSLEKAKRILKNNQYPEEFIEEIIHKTLNNIIAPEKKEEEKTEADEDILFFVNYRGKITDEYTKTLKSICENKESPTSRIPIKIIMTLRKIKTILPSLKASIPKMLKSHVVYQINCPVCADSYVGETERHMTTRLREHILRDGPVKTHIEKCKTELNEEDVIIKMELPNNQKLLTMEALFIKEISPKINTKEEFKSKKLNIKWVVESLFNIKT